MAALSAADVTDVEKSAGVTTTKGRKGTLSECEIKTSHENGNN